MSELRPDDPESLLAQSNWLRRLARGLVRDENAAEDLAQDTWVAALRRKPAAGAADLRAWMNVVARNFARRSKRDAGLRAAHEPRAAREERIEGPDEIGARVELQRKLAEALLALEQPFRSALVLRYLDGLSTIQVAEKLGVSHDAARQRISRGLAKLRERLDHEHHGGRAGWMSALVPFAHAPHATITGGLLLMGTKTKIAIAVLAATFGLWLWKGPLAPAALEAERTAGEAPALAASPEPPPKDATPLASAASAGRSAIPMPSTAPTASESSNLLRGIVLDPDGKAVEGARVEASRSLIFDYHAPEWDIASRMEQAGATTSNAEGLFELKLEPARAYQLSIEKPGFAPATLGRRRTGETVTVHLAPGGTLAGHVTQGEGHLPVVGAHVRCFLVMNDSPDGARFERTTTTDERGAYRFDVLPPRALYVESHATGLPSSGWIPVLPKTGLTITQDLQLQARAWIRGVVRDAATRAPIAGAEIATGFRDCSLASSDASGAFQLATDPFLYGAIYVRATGYGLREQPLPGVGVDTGADNVEILLHPSRSVRGRVLDLRGAPVAHGYVAALAREYDRMDSVAGFTDAEGRYALGELRSDMQHTLFVRAEGFGTLVYEFPASEKEELIIELPDVVLRPAGSITGIVVDENDRPLPDLAIELDGANADRSRWDERPSEDFYTTRQREGRTDDGGRFGFDELAAGEYSVVLRRDSHQVTAQVKLTLADAERKSGVKILQPNGIALSGLVHDRAGHPVRAVNVSIEPTAPGQSDCDVQTGEDGRFSARGIVPGIYRIQLWPYDSDSAHPEVLFHVHTLFENVQADGHELELLIEDGVWLQGLVVEADGTPIAGASLRASEEASQFYANATADAAGHFRMAVEHDQALTVVAQDPPLTRLDEQGRQVPDQTRPGREVCLHGAFGGGAEIRIVMPAK